MVAIAGTFTSLTEATEVQSISATARPSRVGLLAVGPTKFARLIPTDTPVPTETLTPVPTETSTLVPSPTATRASIHIPNPPTLAVTPTETPTATPAALSAQALGADTACATIAGESYASLPAKEGPPDRPAALQADLNLGLRGYQGTIAYTGFVDLGGDADPGAPQLPGLFWDNRTPNSKHVYQVYNWDWATDTRAGLISDPAVTLIGVAVTSGEIIRVPNAGNNIGDGNAVLVLYAAPGRITLKYTGEDNVERGYTLHLEGVCIEPNLLSLYQQDDAAGRGQLPALRAGQGLGRASGDELGIAVRDSGAFLDPRSRKDWWRGR